MEIKHQFKTHLASFLEGMKIRGYSAASIISYGASLRVFQKFLGTQGIVDVRAVDSAKFRAYQLWLQQQNYSGWTILARLQAVRRFLDHLEVTNAILLNPCIGLESPKVAYRLPKVILSADEARRIVEAPNPNTAVGVRDRSIFEIFYSSGIRLEEMTRLNLADVDSANGFLRVNHGKFAKDRVVPLGRSASELVCRYMNEVRARWCAPPENQPALWLSSRPPHERLKSQAIAVMVKRYGRLAGISKKVTPHTWRHTCASHLVAGGANIAFVQRLLGHRSLRTTQVYVRTAISEIKATHALAHPRNQGAAS